MNDPISTKDQEMIDQDMALLLKHFPQYILGYADFYGHRLKVTKDTLIPRPETEELVQLCLDETSDERLDVVDVGTGTGAIAISLKAKRSSWNVSAVDLSDNIAHSKGKCEPGVCRYLFLSWGCLGSRECGKI